MRGKFARILSLILALTFVLSTFTVLTFADGGEGDTASKDDTLTVAVTRTFDEGWDFDNGMQNIMKKQEIKIDYEENADASYNYFLRFTSKNTEVDTD